MIHSIPAGQRNGYFLDILEPHGGVRTVARATLDELANEVKTACVHLFWAEGHASWGGLSEAKRRLAVMRLRAYSQRGKPVDVLPLLHRPEVPRCFSRRFPRCGHAWRGGPVFGIRKRRGGRSHPNIATMAERRLNALWLIDEGEVECRPDRRDSRLFCSRDGRQRSTERCWKSQLKGRKAWDRVQG